MRANFARGIRAGDLAVLAQAITLVESARADHQALAQKLIQELLPDTGKAHRIGITGVPGVGKSTLLDQLGINLTRLGHKVAVLAVDPSSRRSGGSILADKTRMPRLAQDPRAFIRPSPSAGTLGGVTRQTRETMALAEAAGFDIIFVETVGVGQSETAVADMVDVFVVLLLPGAGDALQGIKKGIIEIADIIAVNKADGDTISGARHAAAEYHAALKILTPAEPGWSPPVMTISGQANLGLDTLWENIVAQREAAAASGAYAARRGAQAVTWLHALLEDRLMAALRAETGVAERLRALESEVREGRTTPPLAVNDILDLMRPGGRRAQP